MAINQTFTDYLTIIPADWLNNVNTYVNGHAFTTSIAGLRSLQKTVATTATVTGYLTNGDGGGGTYWYDSSDTTSPDNGGTIIVAADGGRWKLQPTNPVLNVRTFGADATGTNDSTTAINNVGNVTQVGWFPQGTYKTATTPTTLVSGIATQASFTGANPVLNWMPAFLPNPFTAFTTTGENSIVGAVLNNLPSSSPNEPCGITGYGRSNSAGNMAFGIFGRADLYNTGVVTNEVNSFNFFGTFPPQRGIGTTQTLPIAFTVAAGGAYPSSIGIQIAQEGSQPQPFLTGMYIGSDAYQNYGIYIDAVPSDTGVPMFLVHGTGAPCLVLHGSGTPVIGNAAFEYIDGNGITQFSVNQSGQLNFQSTITQTTVGAPGAASVLPTNPTGYLRIGIGASTKIIPYYEP